MRRVELSDRDIEDIRNLFKYPVKKAEVAKKYHISVDTLTRIMIENDIVPYFDHGLKIDLDDITRTRLFELFENSNETLKDIQKELKIDYSVMLKVLREHYDQDALNDRKSSMYSIAKDGNKNPQSNLKREASQKWKGGHPEDGNGYILAFNDGWVYDKPYDSYIFEHQLVFLKALGIHKMPDNGAIHHFDHDRKNNNLSNLALLSSGAHSRLHAYERGYQVHKTYNEQISKNRYFNWLGIKSLPSQFQIFHLDNNDDNWQFNNLYVSTRKADLNYTWSYHN